MNNFYNFDVFPKILKEFKVNSVIISGMKDKTLINAILKYDAKFTQINTNDSECISENPIDALQKFENYPLVIPCLVFWSKFIGEGGKSMGTMVSVLSKLI